MFPKTRLRYRVNFGGPQGVKGFFLKNGANSFFVQTKFSQKPAHVSGLVLTGFFFKKSFKLLNFDMIFRVYLVKNVYPSQISCPLFKILSLVYSLTGNIRLFPFFEPLNLPNSLSISPHQIQY